MTADASGTESVDNPILEVTGLEKYFEQNSGFIDRLLGTEEIVHAVDGVDLTIHEGETLAVVGESGCGKSTLGRSVLNLDHPTAGSVTFRDDELVGLSNTEMRPYRREMQMIFQDPLAPLNPRQKIGAILRAPLEVHGIGSGPEERNELVKSMLERIGLEADHIDRYPHQFSGGQQQRVGIARALMLEPELIIADEPVSALDVSVQAQILDLLEELKSEMGLSMLFITHDLGVVKYVADRVAVMYLGEIVEVGPVDELFRNPHHPYTKALLSAVPRIDREARRNRIVLDGNVPSPVDPPTGCRFHTRCREVIPPKGWAASQEEFHEAFRFRTRAVEDGIDVEGMRRRLGATGDEPSTEDLATHIIETVYEGDLENLSQEKATAIRDAANEFAADDAAEAKQRLAEAFPSPCVESEPDPFSPGSRRTVSCHRAENELDDD